MSFRYGPALLLYKGSLISHGLETFDIFILQQTIHERQWILKHLLW